jgi:FMN phosphatase YigB (HAD superfamily)
LNIFFDVDFTLITWDVRLRPGVHEVFQRLRDEGHRIYLWSGVGPRWEVVRRFELHEHIVDCFWKPLYQHRSRLEELGVSVVPDYVIDDYPEVVDAFDGCLIEPPGTPLELDREMWRVYDAIQAYAANGHPRSPGPAT